MEFKMVWESIEAWENGDGPSGITVDALYELWLAVLVQTSADRPDIAMDATFDVYPEMAKATLRGQVLRWHAPCGASGFEPDEGLDAKETLWRHDRKLRYAFLPVCGWSRRKRRSSCGGRSE